jgi:hypothetical protein
LNRYRKGFDSINKRICVFLPNNFIKVSENMGWIWDRGSEKNLSLINPGVKKALDPRSAIPPQKEKVKKYHVLRS